MKLNPTLVLFFVFSIGTTFPTLGTAQTSRPTKQRAHRAVPKTMSSKEAMAARDRALAWLVKTQKKDGSWADGVIVGLIDSGYSVASFFDWQYAANALACRALLQCDPTEARSKALEAGLLRLATCRLPNRGSDWDNDTVWAALCGVSCFIEVVQDGRFANTPLMAKVRVRAKSLLHNLTRNQVPTGGWGYYDDKPYSRRPKWATSFSTALILPTLKDAMTMGWITDKKILKRAQTYVRRCRLPNGAFQYDMRPIPRSPAGESIDNVKGSLGRIQVCNWGLRKSGDLESVSLKQITIGLTQFMRYHKFLDVARMRPVPHEAYYANAGYFYFFGHYYASRCIELLPASSRESWSAQLRPHIIKTQRPDGSFCDFIGQAYMVVADTSYAIMTLNNGLTAIEKKR